MTLKEAEKGIGREVEYRPSNSNRYVEFGVITSVNHKYVFVRYDKVGSGVATNPEDLRFTQ